LEITTIPEPNETSFFAAGLIFYRWFRRCLRR